MSIARHAQRKFEYQDLATLRFALALLDRQGLQVTPEPDQGEDARIAVDLGGGPIVFELQAKDDPGSLSLATLAAHLAHPAPHRPDGTLFDRLLTDPALRAIVVTSGRCLDEVSPFAAPESWLAGTDVAQPRKRALAKAFLTQFAAVDLKANRYEAARKAHRATLAANVADTAARTALGKVVVVERLTGPAFQADCTRDLSRRLNVPETIADRVLTELLSLVREAKRAGDDIIPGLRAVMARHRQTPIGAPDYERRGQEDAWIRQLEAESVLLLTGPPRCGKSEAAEHIADHFQRNGVEIQQAYDLATARRYLYDTTGPPRLVLLDDPLGDGWDGVNAPASYETLRSLVTRARAQCLLVVAQNAMPLLTSAGAAQIADVATAGKRWLDLSPADGSFLARVWLSKATQAGAVPAQAAQRLAQALEHKEVDLEVGALEHLAFSGSIKQAMAAQDMAALADEDAVTFGRRIAGDNELAARVLLALSLASDPGAPLDETTLAFVAEGRNGAVPAQVKDFTRAVDLFGDYAPAPAPIYDSSPTLSTDAARQVERLENARVLVRTPDGKLGFSHGFYRSAGVSLLRAPAAASIARHLAVIRRGLFCLEPKAARATARHLERIYRAMPDDAARSAVIDAAADGMRSIFPGARDLCFRFLVSRLDDMPAKRRRNLRDWSNQAYSTDLEDVVWRMGEAWLPAETVGGFPRDFFRTPKRREVRADLAALNGAAPVGIAPERAATVLQYYNQYPGQLSRRAMGRLLAMDEAFLRAEAGRIWLKHPRKQDRSLLDRLFEDRHPRLARSLLDGIAEGWPDLTEGRRTDLTDRLARLAASPTVAVPLLKRLVLIARPDEFGDQPPWPLFAAVMPVVLGQLTGRMSGVEPRLFSAVEDAVDHLPPQAMVRICQAWVAWLVQTAKELRGDYAWGVVPILIRATRLEPALRGDLLLPLFEIATRTAPASMLVREMVHDWPDLTEAEQAATRRLLGQDRKDLPWLKAVVLTRRDPPEAVQRLVLNTLLPTAPHEIVQTLPPEVLAACIHVHLGTQPFWYLGLQHAAGSRWDPVIDYLAAHPDHPLADRCLEDFIRQEEPDRILPPMGAWTGKQLDAVFDMLVRQRLGSAGGRALKPVWSALLAQGSPGQREAWDARLAPLATGLFDDVAEIGGELGINIDVQVPKLRAEIIHDLHVLMNVTDALEVLHGDARGLRHWAPMIEKLIRAAEPRLFGTYDRVINRLKAAGLERHGVLKRLEMLRKKAVDTKHALQERFGGKEPEVSKDNWIGRL